MENFKLTVMSLGVLTAVVLFSTAPASAAYDQPTAMSHEAVAHTLNGLVERAVDGQKGYQDAAERVSSPDLKAKFMAKSKERAGFAEELRGEVRDLGETPEKGGSVEAAMHRAWIDVKALVAKNDDRAVLGAVKTGEEEALNAYQESLSEDLPDDIRSMVEKQKEKIESAYEWVVDRLREEEKKAR